VNHWAALRPLLTSLALTTLATFAYFGLPFTDSTGTGMILLIGGLAAVAGLLVWHVSGILHSPYPGIRGVAALATVVPLFLLVFAATYVVTDSVAPGSFSEPLGRLSSLYFTVTVFSTVGFGDIVPVTSTARAITTVQMVGDLVLVGLVAQVIVGAVRRGMQRKDESRVQNSNDARSRSDRTVGR
jgi:voltage-gated potassium channel